MITISYLQMVLFISIFWLLIRTICNLKAKRFAIKRELQLLLVYICIAVVVRFTFCPFGKVGGKIQPLLFDGTKIFPLWVNFKPFVYLFDYPTMREALLNLIGNTAMFKKTYCLHLISLSKISKYYAWKLFFFCIF